MMKILHHKKDMRYLLLLFLCLQACSSGKKILVYDDIVNYTDIPDISYEKITYNVSKQKYYNGVVSSAGYALWRHDSGVSRGIFLKITIKEISYVVPVAPCWYFNNIKIFKAGTKLTIFGVEQVVKKNRMIIPKVIRTESDELWIRNYDGKPFWVMESGKNSGKRNRSNGKGGPGGGDSGRGGGPTGGGR